MAELWSDPTVRAWEAAGTRLRVGEDDVFVVDRPVTEDERHEPLLLVHGFPTSSLDWAGVIDELGRHRRVVALDLPGFGFSSVPDRAYTMAGQADAVAAVCDHLALDRLALLTHDMGDTVGGELLARSLEGTWPVEVTRRVVTNGSIYIGMAQLTDGQLLLLSLPDEALPGGVGAGVDGMTASLDATLAERHRGRDAMRPHAEVVAGGGSARMLPRTIRYIEERRANERRFTGAIEAHPSPLTVVWGPEDPIAVAGMAERLVGVRPDATLRWVDGAGHYPQVEDPAAWLAAVRPGVED